MTTLNKRIILSTIILLFTIYNLFGLPDNVQSKSVTANDSTNSSYQLLTDSISRLQYGKDCGFDGLEQPNGREAIENLIKEKRFSLIRAILDGHNDEGRVYAIEALLELNSEGAIDLTPHDKQKIRRIIEMDFMVFRCLGCEYETISSLELFSENRLHYLLTLNEIKITIANKK